MASTILNTTASWGLMQFPVAIRKASEKKEVKFDRAVKTKDGYERIQRREVGGSTGIVVTGSDEAIVRGIWEGDEFREIPQESIDEITEAGTIESMEIEEFVPLKDVPFYRVEGAYYLCPQSGQVGAKPLKMLRDAMKAEKVAGVAKFSLKKAGRQKLGVIYEQDGKVLVNVLTFADDFRQTEESLEAIDKVAVSREHLKMARELVRRMKGDGRLLEEAKDETVEARQHLFQQALEGKPVKAAKPKEKVAEADDLMAALMASIGGEKVTA